MKRGQYVCLVCGFNMIGFHPDHCPFCGAAKENFITSEECSARYKVASTPVSSKVTRLNSHPPLGRKEERRNAYAKNYPIFMVR